MSAMTRHYPCFATPLIAFDISTSLTVRRQENHRLNRYPPLYYLVSGVVVVSNSKITDGQTL